MFVNIVKMKNFFILTTILIILVLPFIISNGDEEPHNDLHEESFDFLQPIPLMIITTIISGIAVLISLILKKDSEKFKKYKKLLFIIIVVPIIFTSLFMFWGTLYETS